MFDIYPAIEQAILNMSFYTGLIIIVGLKILHILWKVRRAR